MQGLDLPSDDDEKERDASEPRPETLTELGLPPSQNTSDSQMVKENRRDELAEITAENITHAAKSLKAIRGWITFWSILAIIGLFIYTLGLLFSI